MSTAFALMLTILSSGQDRNESGPLKGFTKSPNEHIIVELREPFTVRAVRGVVLDQSGAVMDRVLVEIQDATGRTTGAKTDSKGRFKLHAVPEGTYRFKVTMMSFQSVVGKIVVSHQAEKAAEIKVMMNVGV